MRHVILFTTAALVCLPLATPAAVFAVDQNRVTTETERDRDQNDTRDMDEARDAEEILRESVQVVQQMRQDTKLESRMKQAKGIFIVPDYGKAALVVGGEAGGGVLLVRQANGWSNPAFYNLGGISLGVQAGASGGAIAMLLMTDEAVASFKQQNNFSLDANAGVSFIDWSADAQATAGKGDIILWSDTEGLFAGANVAVSDIHFDDDETNSFYGRKTTPQSILASTSNTTSNTNATNLQQALPK